MCGLVRIGSQFRELSQIIVSRGGLMNRRHQNAFILNLVLMHDMLSCFVKWISGLIFERVFRVLRYLTLFVRDANSFTML